MSYATIADLMARFGEATITGLTDLPRKGVVDEIITQQALDDTATEIDGYLMNRYTLPLPEPLRILTVYYYGIAVYRLCTGRRQLARGIVYHYGATVKFLQLVTAEKIGLGVTKPTGGRPAIQDNSMMFTTREKVFGRDSAY